MELKRHLLAVFVCCSLLIVVAAAERICERQGTCKRCDGKGRFSYYSCSGDADCFNEERCREGFCCPAVNATFFEDPANREFASSFSEESSISGSACPDGSSWMRLCKSDYDCLFDDEVCAVGKCCSSCVAKRRQLIRERGPQALVGVHVPQCSEDGRFYQMKQCVHGFPLECFCTSLYGERVRPAGVHQSGVICSEGERPAQQQADPRAERHLPEHYLTVGRGLFQETMMQSPPTNCMDSMKEFVPCRSACQVTCDTRTKPICPFAGRCSPGCQCKVPYISESSGDLDSSRCVLPAQCPTHRPVPTPGKVFYRPPTGFPFNADPGTESSQSRLFSQFPHGAMGAGVDRSKQMHCSDPLKNFLTCGSACPAACERLVPACSFQCVSGCFCRTPYVLGDMDDVNSACILPQHCEIQGKKNPFDPEPGQEDDVDENKGFYPQSTSEAPPTASTASESADETTTEAPSTTTRLPATLLPPITCPDPDKEFKSCASSCPLACDNLDAELCSPCVGGCFCKNGLVFESVKNWTDGRCVKVDACRPRQAPPQAQESTDKAAAPQTDAEAIGAKLYSLDGHVEIGTFIFSTANDQKIRFDSRIEHLPPSRSRTFVLTIHKYGSLATDASCESIGQVVEVNPVYTYPYPNGTLLYLEDVKLPYTTGYTFQASTDFAARSVGAVIGRSLALHELLDPHSDGKKIGKPLGCATIGILRG